MNRREFSALSALLITPFSIFTNQSKKKINTVKVPRLSKGDTIGIIAPASMITEDRILKAHEYLQNLGFKIKEGQYIRGQYGYFSGTDEERLTDLHAMYQDKSVNAVWCLRGGYGCTRLVNNIDYKLIQQNPKALIGFSDITALHNAIFQETGIFGFHGPHSSAEPIEYNQKSFKAILQKGVSDFQFSRYNGKSKKPYADLQIWKEGKAEGRIKGGNLSLMAAMVGTKHAIDYENAIVFIEDIGEEPYRIDRMLTQLLDGSNIRKANAIVLGQFSGCNPDNPDRSLSLEECLKDRLVPLDLPMIFGANFGHVEHNFTFPIGANISVDTAEKSIRLLESCAK